MTYTSTRSILAATLLLSSSIGPSEAFSATSTLPVTQQQQQRTRLSYAPKDSLDSGRPKPRGRGRPRKAAASSSTPTTAAKKPKVSKKSSTTARRTAKTTTSTTLAASATDTGAAAVSKKTKTKTRRGKNKGALSSAAADNYSPINTGMLEHELLSKQEELVLGAQVQRAIQIQQAVVSWWEEQSIKRQLHQEQFGNDSEDDYTNLSVYGLDSSSSSHVDAANHPLLYGTTAGQAMERQMLFSQEEELFYPDGTPFEGEEAFGMSTFDSLIFEQQPQKPAPYTPESWMDDVLEMDRQQAAPPLSSSTDNSLTDEDIRNELGIPGGRTELRTILLEGAMAQEKLIRCNVKLVTSIAKRWVGDQPQSSSLVRAYNGGGANSIVGRPTLDEAIQEGVLGLQEAAIRFDPGRGFRFSTYATAWINNRVRRIFQLESSSGIRLPTQHYEIKRNYINRVRHYIRTHRSVPSMEKLADDLGVTEKRLIKALRMTQPLASLDSPLATAASLGAGKAGGVESAGGESDYSLASLLACDEPLPEDHVERSLLRQCLENIMATELSPSERDVIRMRLGLDDGVIRSVKEVSDVFAGRLTVAAIRNIEQRAYNKLRSPWTVHNYNLLAYVDFAGIDGSTQRHYKS
ncbi:sigma factor SigA [Seminavis robusta]|uniref:Sigma factor SigA n=1 Tax=Seminavis robusta TaxID=568900 RepID=A0A9N8H039_9STRA|nr:sigma factor SigA [Seminavis robusta]|eukprot:Sro13_g010330.1 sigma factor SigA (633) ;mRNA; r:182902-185041